MKRGNAGAASGQAKKRSLTWEEKQKWGARFGKNFSDAVASLLRAGFVQGQADYRAGNPKPDSDNDTFMEGWDMGWAADAEIERRGLQLAPLGIFVPPPEELDEEEQIIFVEEYRE